ncbi:hypothetical protein EK21DRAFT_88200 [Setomelanomma holmii]|uniref:Uncharacterized protein n=1 Tax=Setomelanomma holmii TaxID=210430 RepID=A0A9P4HBZ0_9PLEO|nr:hypothetical protein EK21DRAFT_88200 [Setomelanomma holmii]
MWIVPFLPSVPGWETDDDLTAPSPIFPDEPKPPRIMTTQIPTIIDIETNVVPTSILGSGNGNNVLRPASNIVTSYSIRPAQDTPGAQAQETPGNNLFLNIISRIGKTQQQAQPTPVQSPAAGDQTVNPAHSSCGGDQTRTPAQLPQVTPSPKAASDANAPPVQAAQATLPVGRVVTAGPATLTLTPGLSTTIGTGNGATFIGITTNAAGQTLITVSASGTEPQRP